MPSNGRVGSSPTSGTNLISIIWKDIQKNLLKYIEKNTLKSDEELESLKSLLRNVHCDGFIAGEESIINVVDKLTKRN